MNSIPFSGRKYNLPKNFRKIEYTQRYCLFNPSNKTPQNIWTFYPDGTCEHTDKGIFGREPSSERVIIDSEKITDFFNAIRQCALNRTDMIMYVDDLVEELIIHTDKRIYILDRGITCENTSIGKLAWILIETVFPNN